MCIRDRDISSHMSVGLNFQVALEEAIKSPQTSPIISREFQEVQNAIYTGKAMSDAFMEMYSRLRIKEKMCIRDRINIK